MNIINKIKKFPIEYAFYAYIFFNIVNLTVHLIGFFSYPMLAQVDYGLYIIKVALIYGICIVLSKKSLMFSKQSKMFKGIFILDLIELFINVFAYRFFQTYAVIGGIIFLKSILDYWIFASLILRGKHKAKETFNTKLEDRFKKLLSKWISVHVLILIAFVYLAFINGSLILQIALFIFVTWRFIQQIIIVNTLWGNIIKRPVSIDTNENTPKVNDIYEKINKKQPIPVSRIIMFGIGGCLLVFLIVCFFYMRNSYIYGTKPLTDYDGNIVTSQKSVDDLRDEHENHYPTFDNVFQYNACNRMPSWSIFYHEKYGLINSVTGENTGAKYDGYLFFDESGIAYDYDRHFIDRSGEEVLKVSYIVKARTSYRQELLNLFLKAINDEYYYNEYVMATRKDYIHYGWEDHIRNEYSSYLEWYFDLNSEDEKYVFVYTDYFFENGVAAYYSDLNGRYGLISDDGSLVTLPKFGDINTHDKYEVSVVSDYFDKNKYVINSKGKPILDKRNSYYQNFTNSDVILCDGWYLYSFDGELLDTGDFEALGRRGDVACFIKKDNHKDDNGTLLVYSGNAKLILSTDIYTDCYGRADENGEVKYLIVTNKDGKQSLIDLDGNLVCPNHYYDVSPTNDSNIFLGVNDDYSFDYIYTDGTVTSYNYKIMEYQSITEKYRICKMDDETQFNYIDLEGNLLQDWFTEDEE